jgi:hypothetical protein
MITLKDFLKPKDSLNESKHDKPVLQPKYDEKGLRIETPEEIENWKKI